MAARGNRSGEESAELNLVPFMNMVVVIIPMLLLSVVFLKAGVINITSPKLSPAGPPSEKKPEKKKKPLNLTVAVGDKGFRIGATGATLPPQGSCSKPGPTLCLADDSIDVGAKIEEARTAYEEGGREATRKGNKILQSAMQAYDWMGLYNKLFEIKKKYPDETVVKIMADPDIPYALIVRVMDVVRYKLPEESYDNRKQFWSAEPETDVKEGKKVAKKLFNDPILAIGK
jgi:biopolymer transport protein ExbD